MRRRLALAVLVVLILVASGTVYAWWRSYNTAKQHAHKAVLAYIALTEDYSAPETWALLYSVDPATLEQSHRVLEGITPPPEMAEAHANLLQGYDNILEGRKTIARSVSDGELMEEGEFQLSWGLSRVQEHYRLIQAYRAEHP